LANVNGAFGLRPVRNGNGNAPRVTKYAAAATVYEGSPVCFDGNGAIIQYTNALALTGDIAGVAANYATSGQDVYVYTDPNQVYEIQITGAATVAAGDYQAMFRFAANPEAGSAVTFTSTASLDIATAGVTAAGAATATPLRLLSYPRRPNNDITLQNAVVNVMLVPCYTSFGMTMGSAAADTYTTS
jgi:hypothetical protein